MTNISTNVSVQVGNVSSMTVSTQLSLPYVTPGQCTTVNSAGQVIGVACGSGAASVAVTTGNASGFNSLVSSPTAVINFDSTTFLVGLKGAATSYILPNPSSVTLQGNNLSGTYLTNSSATATYLQQSSATATYLQQSSATLTYIQVSTTLAVAHGGTGTSNPGLIAGTNINSITGTWPNQVINASGGSFSPGSTNYIQATSTLQSGATFYVSSGTVNGPFSVTSTNTNLLSIPGTGTGGTGYLWAQGANGSAPSTFDLVYSALNNGTTISNLLFSNSAVGNNVVGWNFQNGSGTTEASISTAGALTLNGSGNGSGQFTISGSTYGIISDSTSPTTVGQCAVFSSTNGTVTGQTCSSGGGTPGGSSGQLQYNSASSFSGVNGSFVTSSSVTLPTTAIASSGTFTIFGPTSSNYFDESMTNSLVTFQFFASGVQNNLLTWGSAPTGMSLNDPFFVTGSGNVIQANGALLSVDSGAGNLTASGILDLWSASGQPNYISFNEHGIENNGTIGFGAGNPDMIFYTGSETFGSGTERFRISPTKGVISSSSMTVAGAGGLGVTYNLNVGSMTGAGLSSCSGGSNAVTWNSVTGKFGCNTISGGSGVVNSGTAGQVAYYPTSTSVVSSSNAIQFGAISVSISSPSLSGPIVLNQAGTGALPNTNMLVSDTSKNNVCLGLACLQDNGTNNTALGSMAGENLTTSSNVAIGYGAMSSISTGFGNIAIGANTSISNNLTNAVCIGLNCALSSSNTMQLGGTGANALVVNASTITASSETLTGNLSFNPTTNGIQGTTAGDNANSGLVGVYISTSSGQINMPSTGNYGDLGSISLPAGDWDVSITYDCALNGATISGGFSVGISQTSGNSSTGLVNGVNQIFPPDPTSTADSAGSLANVRFNLTTTTILYFKMKVSYTGGPPVLGGIISARTRR